MKKCEPKMSKADMKKMEAEMAKKRGGKKKC